MNRLTCLAVLMGMVACAGHVDGQQQPRAAVYLAIVKASAPAAQVGLQDWSQAFKRGLDVVLYDAMSSAFGRSRIQVQKVDYDEALPIDRLELLRRQREAIYIVSAVASQSGDVTTISSTVMLGDLSGGLPQVLELRQKVNLSEYHADRDALTVLTLYGLANEADRLQKVPAACRLLAKANLLIPDANLKEASLTVLPDLIRSSQKSKSCV